MASIDRPLGPLASEAASGLPQLPRTFRLELLRRLELLEREVQALLDSGMPRSLLGSVAALRSMEKDLRERLASDSDSATWLETRAEIVVIWRCHRRAFEELASECRQRYEARAGRRERGPRW